MTHAHSLRVCVCVKQLLSHDIPCLCLEAWKRERSHLHSLKPWQRFYFVVWTPSASIELVGLLGLEFAVLARFVG